MREIKFRGKRLGNGEWVYGWLLKLLDGGYIIVSEAAKTTESHPHYPAISLGVYYEVDPDTVGQFTGLKDKNGKEIYEGDIVLDHQISPSRGNIRAVEDLGDICWIFQDQQNQDKNVYEVIGNIMENKDLLNDSKTMEKD